MSHAVQVLQGTLRRLLMIQAALALLTAVGFYASEGVMAGVAALFGGGIALFNSLISALHLARASHVGDPKYQMAVLYFGAAIRFMATPALVAVGILVFGLGAVPIIVGFAVAQIAYMFGSARPGSVKSNQAS